MNNKGIKDKIHICAGCGNEFKQKYYSQKKPKYCNSTCAIKHQSRQRIEKSNEGFDDGLVVYFETQKRILTERFGYKCSCCSISEWQNNPLTLQVDHIDGDPGNNKGSNLRLLCPNCHSQTPTYKGGNKKNPKQDRRSRLHRAIYKKKFE